MNTPESDITAPRLRTPGATYEDRQRLWQQFKALAGLATPAGILAWGAQQAVGQERVLELLKSVVLAPLTLDEAARRPAGTADTLLLRLLPLLPEDLLWEAASGRNEGQGALQECYPALAQELHTRALARPFDNPPQAAQGAEPVSAGLAQACAALKPLAVSPQDLPAADALLTTLLASGAAQDQSPEIHPGRSA